MERNKLISVLQVFGILLVVLGHCQSGVSPKPLWYDWIYSFHMPLFFFISGYLLKLTNEKKGCGVGAQPWWGTQGWIWKKTKRLLVPYLVISTFAYLPKVLMSRYALRPVDLSWNAYLEMLAYPVQNVIGFFWFLPTLFVVFALVMAAGRCAGAKRMSWLYYLLLPFAFLLSLYNPLLELNDYVFSVFNMSGAVTHLFYFALGYYVRAWHLIRENASQVGLKVLLTFAVSVAMVVAKPDGLGDIGERVWDILAAVNGIIMSVQLCLLYVQRDRHFLDFLFGASYAIYLFSWFPQTASQQVFVSLTGSPRWVGSVLAFFTGVYLPWLIYKWIRCHKEGRVGKVIAFLSGM